MKKFSFVVLMLSLGACGAEVTEVAEDTPAPSALAEREDAASAQENYADGRRFFTPSTVTSSIIAGLEPRQVFELKKGPIKGTKLMLPFFYSQARALSLVTVADARQVSLELAAQGLEIYPIEEHPLYGLLAPTEEAKQKLVGKCVVSIYADQMAQSTVGPFAPTFFGVWVKNPKDKNGQAIKEQPQLPGEPVSQAVDGKPAIYFIPGYYVTNTREANDFGIEAWGVPKTLGDTNADYNGDRKEFTSYRNGQQVAKLALADVKRLAPFGHDLESLNLVTPKNGPGPRTVNSGDLEADVSGGAFMPELDSFDVNPQTSSFKVLHKLGVVGDNGRMADDQAAFWLWLDNLSFVYHTDLSQVPAHRNDPVTDGSDPSRREW